MHFTVKNKLSNLSFNEYQTLKLLCHLSKNLFNEALYNVRQFYFAETGKHYEPREEENLLGVDDDIAYYYFDDAALDYDLLGVVGKLKVNNDRSK